MTEPGAARVLKIDDLAPTPGSTGRFEGYEHGANVSFFVSRVPAGGGPGLHVHPYEETFVIHEGSATFVVGAETVEVEPEMIIIVPPATPHRFTAGPDGLRSVNIHGNDRMIQEDLPDDGMAS
jgi:mannose-6-phosphate isomerase-like protein (cupin superfamily)